MMEHRPESGSDSDLVVRAQRMAELDALHTADVARGLAPDDALKMLHSLRVHQIELEMQNEDLRRAQEALEVSRARYFDLYELAPVGYLTLDRHGKILAANMTAATLFGVSRTSMLGQLLTRYILPVDQDIFYFCRKRLIDAGVLQACQLRLCKPDGCQVWVHLDATPERPDPVADYLVTLSDITAQVEAKEAELATLLAHQRMAVQEEERRHVALELHDEIGQILTGIHFILGSSRDLPLEALDRAVERSQELVLQAISRTRDLAQSLRPTILDEMGLLSALTAYIRYYESVTTVIVTFEHCGLPVRFKANMEITAYRVVQEALTNIVRHAHVHAAVVRVNYKDSLLSIVVQDQGVGFDSEAPRPNDRRSSGLGGMRERVELLGGKFVLTTQVGEGCRIEASLPVRTLGN